MTHDVEFHPRFFWWANSINDGFPERAVHHGSLRGGLSNGPSVVGQFLGNFFGPGAPETGYGFRVSLRSPDPDAGLSIAILVSPLQNADAIPISPLIRL